MEALVDVAGKGGDRTVAAVEAVGAVVAAVQTVGASLYHIVLSKDQEIVIEQHDLHVRGHLRPWLSPAWVGQAPVGPSRVAHESLPYSHHQQA